MGKHGMRILAQLAMASNEDSKDLRNQLRELKNECKLLKRVSPTVSFIFFIILVCEVLVTKTSNDENEPIAMKQKHHKLL